MTNNRLSLLTLLVLGVIGPGAAWPAPAAPTTPPAAPVAAAAVAPISFKEQADLRARVIDLRNRQQVAPDDPEISYELGALYLDAGDPKAAEEQLRRAIDQGTTAADAWVLLGKAWLLQEKYVEIQAQIPVDQLPDAAAQAGVAALQGQAWLAKGRLGEARRQFQEALALEPNLADGYLGLAQVSMAEGNLAAAAEALTSAAGGLQPDLAEIATQRGELALLTKDLTTAESAFQAGVNAKPYQYWRRRQLAHVQVMQNRLDEADANIALLRQANPGDLAATYLGGFSAYLRGDYQRAYDTVSPMLQGKVQEPGALFVAGASAYRLGNYNQARELLAPYLEGTPADQTARGLLAAALLRLGEPGEALKTLTPLLDGNPSAGVLALAGQAAVLSGDPKAAVAHLERAVGLEPKDTRLARLLGAAKIAANDRKAGIAALERVVADGGDGAEDLEFALLQERLTDGDLPGLLTAAASFTQRYPKRADGRLLLGIAQARTGALQEARGTFETVLGQSPNNLDALIGLADVSLRQGDAAGAEKAMGRALAQRPKDLVLLKNFANLYLAVGKPDQAVARLEQAQQADPANQALVRLLAAVYTSAGQPLDALRLLADKGDAKDPAVQTQQGEAELRAGRNEAAEKTFRAVADAAPAAAAYVNLGRALEAEGQLVPAADAFKKALALEPANASAALGVARVELLGLTAPVDPVRAKRAMDAVAKTLQQYPSGPESARLRAAVGLVTGQAPASRKVLQSLYDAAPGAESVTDLATACRLTGDTKGAITLLRTHLERYPKDLSVRLTLARYLMAERQPAAAVTELAKLVEQDWGNIDAHTDLAAALIQAGRAAEARTHAAAAAKARPDDERVKALVKAAK